MAGTVAIWGSNSSGQANVPGNLTSVQAIASGSQSLFNLALTTGGTVTGWGNDNQNQTNVPAGLTNIAAIAAGANFGLAIGNQLPMANNVTVSGYVNHDLTLTLLGSDPDGNPLNFYVATLPAAGVLYQYSNGARGSLIGSPNTLVADSSGRVVFAPANGATGSPYAGFNFMAADQFYQSGTAQATINIALPAMPQFGNLSWASGGKNFTLNFSGSPNATYSVWSSTNLFNWVDLGPATEGQPGLYQFVDTAVTNSPLQFYRLSAP